jgi:alkyl hydroperoxide reductase subunit F
LKGVKIYTLRGCPFCNRTKAFLTEKGIYFKEIEVLPKSEEWTAMKAVTKGGSLPQIVLDDEAIGGYGDLVGLEASGELWEKLGMPIPKDVPPIYDLIIIGGGPAGLSAAVYAARKLLKTLIISKDIGGQVTWTFDIDNYLGFSGIDTVDLISKFNEHVDKYGLVKMEGVEVISLDITGVIKKVFCDDGKLFNAKTTILSMGKRPRSLGVPGEKELLGKGVAYCSTCDAPLFQGLNTAVIGGGNSALEAALDLIKVAKKIYLISLTQLTGDPILIDKLKASDKVDILTKYSTLSIKGDKVVSGIEIKSLDGGSVKNLEVEGVFIEIGLLPNSELVIDTMATNSSGEIIVDSKCQTGMAGVFAAGDVTDVPFKQVIVAAGEGAKAALSAYSYIINQK